MGMDPFPIVSLLSPLIYNYGYANITVYGDFLIVIEILPVDLIKSYQFVTGCEITRRQLFC